MKDRTADQAKVTAGLPLTPEQVVLSMTLREVQELLAQVRMSSDVITAQRLRRLVRELGEFERAIDAIGGPASLGRSAETPDAAVLRRAA